MDENKLQLIDHGDDIYGDDGSMSHILYQSVKIV